jgi:hypothetical protein
MMANKRTVDPDSLEPSVKIVGLRLTSKQLQYIEMLCEQEKCSRSELFRRLLNREAYKAMEPQPF